MSDTAFEVRYMRRSQIAQFEPQEAEIKAVFNDNGEGDMVLAESKLRQCREAVERVLGLSVAVVKATDSGQADQSAKTEDTPAQVEEKKKRGRPTNAEVAEKRALEAKARLAAEDALKKAPVDPMDDITDLMTDAPNISNGEDRVDPMAEVVDDIPELKAAEAAQEPERNITDQELQNQAGEAVRRLGDANIIRSMVRTNYRVTRLDEVPQERRRAIVSDLKNLQKDGSIKAPEKK